MKTILLLIAILTLANYSFAAPLIFKATKTIKTSGNDYVEIATFDAAKYQTIRIGIIVVEGKGSLGRVDAIEGSDVILLAPVDVLNNRSYLIENPSGRIRLSMKESGTYRVFVWGVQ